MIVWARSQNLAAATFYDHDGGRMIVLNEHSIKRGKISRQKTEEGQEALKTPDYSF